MFSLVTIFGFVLFCFFFVHLSKTISFLSMEPFSFKTSVISLLRDSV